MDPNVQKLIDLEEIKQLKHKYCEACDDNYNPSGIASLFTEDGIWDGGGLGVAETRSGIEDFFKAVPGIVEFAIHSVSNSIIEVKGDTATGRWLLWQPMVYKENGLAVWYSAKYSETYQRTRDGWKIKHLKLTNLMHTPYEEGFGKMLFSDDSLKP